MEWALASVWFVVGLGVLFVFSKSGTVALALGIAALFLVYNDNFDGMIRAAAGVVVAWGFMKMLQLYRQGKW